MSEADRQSGERRAGRRGDPVTVTPEVPGAAGTAGKRGADAGTSAQGPGTHVSLPEDGAFLRAVLNSVLDPVISTDDHGIVLDANPAVERVLGYARDDLIGRNIKLLMPEPHRSLHDGYLETYRRTGRTWILNTTRDFEVLRKDGTRLTCSLSVSRWELPDGTGAVLTGTFRDVTRQREAERRLRDSEVRFHGIFDNSFEYLGLLGVDGTVLEVNRAALDGAALRREDVVGRPFWETRWWTHSPELQERVRESIAAAARGEFVRFEARYLGRDGALVEMDFSLKPVRDASGEVVLLIPEGRDIGAIKRAQRAETAVLRALASIGESAALLAHEIKSPITAVNVALRAVADQLGEDDRAVLEDLVKRMQRVEQLMRSTLSFAKPLELQLAELDLTRFLPSCVEHMAHAFQAVEARVDLDVGTAPLPLLGDPQRLEEVVTNLITNAMEACDGRPVRIVVGASGTSAGAVTISVEDDGPGIAPSTRPLLFRPFATTKRKGNGLGLAISKKIVEEHGGTIEVTEGILGGARFELRFPGRPT